MQIVLLMIFAFCVCCFAIATALGHFPGAAIAAVACIGAYLIFKRAEDLSGS